MASFNGELEMAKVLVANGANVNAENSNAETPLIIAERYGYVELANFLLVRFSQKVIEIGPIHITLLLNQIFIVFSGVRGYLKILRSRQVLPKHGQDNIQKRTFPRFCLKPWSGHVPMSSYVLAPLVIVLQKF